MNQHVCNYPDEGVRAGCKWTCPKCGARWELSWRVDAGEIGVPQKTQETTHPIGGAGGRDA
jgi:hypothetical protein